MLIVKFCTREIVILVLLYIANGTCDLFGFLNFVWSYRELTSFIQVEVDISNLLIMILIDSSSIFVSLILLSQSS